MSYVGVVNVTITHLRQNLLELVDSVLEGEVLEFTHKGVVFRIVPQNRSSKLARLTGQKVMATETDLEQEGRNLLAEMKSEWEKDWSEL